MSRGAFLMRGLPRRPPFSASPCPKRSLVGRPAKRHCTALRRPGVRRAALMLAALPLLPPTRGWPPPEPSLPPQGPTPGRAPGAAAPLQLPSPCHRLAAHTLADRGALGSTAGRGRQLCRGRRLRACAPGRRLKRGRAAVGGSGFGGGGCTVKKRSGSAVSCNGRRRRGGQTNKCRSTTHCGSRLGWRPSHAGGRQGNTRRAATPRAAAAAGVAPARPPRARPWRRRRAAQAGAPSRAPSPPPGSAPCGQGARGRQRAGRGVGPLARGGGRRHRRPWPFPLRASRHPLSTQQAAPNAFTLSLPQPRAPGAPPAGAHRAEVALQVCRPPAVEPHKQPQRRGALRRVAQHVQPPRARERRRCGGEPDDRDRARARAEAEDGRHLEGERRAGRRARERAAAGRERGGAQRGPARGPERLRGGAGPGRTGGVGVGTGRRRRDKACPLCLSSTEAPCPRPLHLWRV
jgi:hypothetical protein